jgi:hypothetical protein
VRHEALGELRLLLKQLDHRGPSDANDRRLGHRRRGRGANRLAGETGFAKEIAGLEHGHDRGSPALRNHRQLDLALLEVVDGVRRIALGEDDLLPPVRADRASPDHSRQQGLRIEPCRLLSIHPGLH